ncbi:hypothetical protein STEG23_011597, partial [Scotinomys teguina]
LYDFPTQHHQSQIKCLNTLLRELSFSNINPVTISLLKITQWLSLQFPTDSGLQVMEEDKALVVNSEPLHNYALVALSEAFCEETKS